MKKILLIFLLILILPNVCALKGVGLQWYTESTQIEEGATVCVNYGIYNPWDEDITTGLIASGEIAQFAKPVTPKLVPAETFHDKSMPVQICFKIPRIYDKNCKLGPFMCDHDCSQKITYSGEVSAVEMAPAGRIKATGSATAASIAADLRIDVLCKERGLEWLVIPAIGLAILGLLIFFKWPTSKRRKEKYMSLRSELENLRTELETDVHNLEKRARYEKLWKKLEKLREKL